MDDAFGLPQSMVVLGGTSDIATALVRRLVAARCRTVVLAGRDPEALARAAGTLRREGAAASVVTFDAADVSSAGAVVERCVAQAGGEVDLVVMAVGQLGEPGHEADPARVAEMATVNFTWPAAAMAAVAGRLCAQGHGRLVVLSSVAGVRVRRANYVYGATKAGLDGFALGLADTLRGSGASVQIVRPGFVRTKMTAGRRAAALATGPEQVAAAIVAAMADGRTVVWVPPVLRWAFLVLRHLPAALWRRLPG
ncbi:MAG TPA: SDR family NAD(P)-dependent oxidoreductase [Acidimicrobiales bacterium]|nr:SDR family NAD(P)-dependent oxidoreductase [Acidimicrobiales bacterium]